MNNANQEIEVRFLEIDKAKLIERLVSLGAQDHGEQLLQEIIFYDKEMRWRDSEHKFVRLRRIGEGKPVMTYKHHHTPSTADGTEEIEVEIDDIKKAEEILVRLGLVAYRHQEKLRHSFSLGEVIIDIDTWPRIPVYVEIEGPNEEALKDAAQRIDLDWDKAVFKDARWVIENIYNIPVGNMRWFTFTRF